MSRLAALALVVVAFGCGGGKGDDDEPVLVDAPKPPIDSPVVIDAPPTPDAPPPGVTCQMKDPVVQLGFTCDFVWSMCSDAATYEVNCRIQNVGGNVFSLCDCKLNGGAAGQFISTMICGSTEWTQVEAIANPECGWMLR
ncbi:MAG TPA: hypothetical protein VFQ53_02465 [Kofleriaceae bacterium]|nr:hypothetical protein [Kofleriaceae bacterium]